MSSKYNLLPVPHSSTLKLGIMGGSFDPPHVGHKYITEYILNKFSLNKIVWVPTVQNPLKINKPGEFYNRLFEAQDMICNYNVLISDFEKVSNIRYTIELIKRIKTIFPNIKLYYIIGADNALNFNKWKDWREICKFVTLIIFDRDDCHFEFMKSKLYNHFKGSIVTQKLKLEKSNFWYYVKARKNLQSSTQLRNQKNE